MSENKAILAFDGFVLTSSLKIMLEATCFATTFRVSLMQFIEIDNFIAIPLLPRLEP